MDQVSKRMRKVGRKKNFMIESQANEQEQNESIVIVNRRSDQGISTIDLVLEPNKFDKLSSECRLSYDEYCDVINDLLDEEESEWEELRMKDQINITRDAIMEATIMKYAKEEYGIKKEDYAGTDINYHKRYDREGRFIGEAVIVTLTVIPEMKINN